MALTWNCAHNWSENHTKAMDEDLINPPQSVINKLIMEKNNQSKEYILKQRALDDLIIHCKNKLIDYCIDHLNESFKMCEPMKDIPEIKPHHYVRLLTETNNELSLMEYYIEKKERLYKCIKR